ncbi:hypothetical protein PENCOP_c015G07961 [Penicillium coprophilum]|uniref:Uncharacterized protein n=1 Tax=Penicillium coprophilum TaxID=36646 RepID=A0A1V6U9Q1_9EURO|nr:hypothetical protein PENCOP_c015G07961 [Penicillium coprophilum]
MEEYGPYPKAFDFAGDLGYGRANAGENSKFYHPRSMPSNGTKTLSNVVGTVSAPVSGNTFTRTFDSTTNSVMHTVTVSSVDATATGSKGGSSGSNVTATSSPTGTAESDAKPGMGSLSVFSWAISGSIGARMVLAL